MTLEAGGEKFEMTGTQLRHAAQLLTREYRRILYDGKKVTIVWVEKEGGVDTEKKIVSTDPPDAVFVEALQRFADPVLRALKAGARGEGLPILGISLDTDDKGIRTVTVKARTVGGAADVGVTGDMVRLAEKRATEYLDTLHAPELFDGEGDDDE